MFNILNKFRSINRRWENHYSTIANLLAYPQTLEARNRNPLSSKGESYFSQNDEDGIILEIVRRIGIEKSVFVELGVGNGLENNTIILLASGWRGIWIGGEQLAFANASPNSRLAFNQAWIDRDNVFNLVAQQLQKLQCSPKDVELLSIDLDGNDAYLIPPLLARGLSPSVIVCEYNGKFPPPIRFCIEYNARHEWDYSDYQGASLQVFVDIFSNHGYKLVCCNSNGVNAFFVRDDHLEFFKDVPVETADLFVASKYLARSPTGHQTSPKTIEALISRNDNPYL
jgi:hypothetical protein